LEASENAVMVGETGFEPATLCSQSGYLPREIKRVAVNLVENGPNEINRLPKRC